MDTLLHTTKGAVPMHTAIENDMQAEQEDKFVRWEALRERANTIGARAALDEAMKGGHVLFQYLWFLIVVSVLLLAVAKVGGCQEATEREAAGTPAVR